MSVFLKGKAEVDGKTIFGPEVVLSGLKVYYDFSNPASYPGFGSTVYDISGNRNHAIISGSGTSLPTLIPDNEYARGYMSFSSANEQFMRTILPTWGTSFTQIVICASPGSTWDGIGSIGSVRWDWEGSNSNLVNGWVNDAMNLSAWSYDSGSFTAVEYKTSIPLQSTFTDIGFNLPQDQTVPNFYCKGYNHNNGEFTNCLNSNIITYGLGSILTNRGPRTNTRIYFARLDERYGPALARFTSVNFYLYMLYDRLLSEAEIALNYEALKFRFGF